MSTSTQIITDEQQILDHIHGIFRAYLDKDRDTIRRTHTEDWVGFQVGSREMVRGINAYMLNADATLDNTIPVAYDLLDTDISVYDDVAIVYYLASYTYRDHEDEENTVRLRSVDIYRKDDDGHWNQCGSNICRVPQPSDNPSVDATRPRVLVPREQAELLEARESVWRAWFAGDVDALRELVPEETIAIEPDSGDWADLAEIMRRSRTFIDSGAKLVRLEFPATQIQAFGPVAILYTTYLFEIESAEGQHTTTAGRGTEIFVKRDGHWVNPGWHLDSGDLVPFRDVCEAREGVGTRGQRAKASKWASNCVSRFRLPFDVGSGSWGVAVGDVNGDERPDTVTPNQESNNTTVLLGHSDGCDT